MNQPKKADRGRQGAIVRDTTTTRMADAHQQLKFEQQPVGLVCQGLYAQPTQNIFELAD